MRGVGSNIMYPLQRERPELMLAAEADTTALGRWGERLAHAFLDTQVATRAAVIFPPPALHHTDQMTVCLY